MTAWTKTVRGSQIVKGMTIKIDGWGQKTDFEVTFARKHRRYQGYMQVQGNGSAGFQELSLKQSDIFERVK